MFRLLAALALVSFSSALILPEKAEEHKLAVDASAKAPVTSLAEAQGNEDSSKDAEAVEVQQTSDDASEAAAVTEAPATAPPPEDDGLEMPSDIDDDPQ
mmetsp:Transcript_56496/g.105937  ORF Transcript_56496/g.105937 Transcript_56496/m.105937 type:complete len:99 (+) Transcript_56496:64-360(+)